MRFATHEGPPPVGGSRHLPAGLLDELHAAAREHVADAADVVARAARAPEAPPGAFPQARAVLERRLMRLRLIEAGQPVPAPDLDELVGFVVEGVQDDLRRLLDEPDPRFDRVAELAGRAHALSELLQG